MTAGSTSLAYVALALLALSAGWGVLRSRAGVDPVAEATRSAGMDSSAPERAATSRSLAGGRSLHAWSSEERATNDAEVEPFSSRERLARLRVVVEDVGDTLDPAEARALWEASGLDTERVYQQAISVIVDDYLLPMDRQQIEAKVLALHVATRSSWVNLDDCHWVLHHHAAAFEEAAEEAVRNALMWDALGMAKICARLDRAATEQYLAAMSKGPIAAQVALGVQVVRESSDPSHFSSMPAH
ncbi:hypothetical protein WMF30_43745 [Sorangium sp. So ce134]